jgi:hypothetical protein
MGGKRYVLELLYLELKKKRGQKRRLTERPVK